MNREAERKSQFARGHTLAIAAIVMAVAMWGLAPVATRFLVGSVEQKITPGALLALRFGLSALALIPFALRAGFHRWNRRDQMECMVAALCGVVGYNLPVTLGQVTVPAGTTALIIATEPIWILILWSLRKKTVPTWGAAIGALIGLVGIVILEIGDAGRLGFKDATGLSLVMLGAFFWSAYCVFAADLVRRKGALAITSTTVVIGCVPFLIVNGAELPGAVRTFDSVTVIMIAALAFGSTVIATVLWNHGVAAIPGPRSGSFLHGVPVVGVFAGHFVLGEALSFRVALAALFVTAGVALAQFEEKRGGRSDRLSVVSRWFRIRSNDLP